jgi:hypothetical protein
MLSRLILIDRTNAMRAFGRAKKLPDDIIRASCPYPWVADVTDGNRVFIKGYTDYRNANADGSSGVEVLFVLWPDRVYEVCEPDPPRLPVRFRCKADNGDIIRL